MLEQIILGIVQGIAEWLPISSEGLLVLIKSNFFSESGGVEALIKAALFLHLGTFMAALIYFWKDVAALFKTMFNYRSAEPELKKIFNFLLLATLVSGVLGFLLLKAIVGLEEQFLLSGKAVNLVIGLLLLITAVLQIKVRKGDYKKEGDLTGKDGVLLGLMQGLAVLPGLSRSGLTISALLLRKFGDIAALRLSFLMSLPIVLAGNIILNLNDFVVSRELIWGLFFSFVFGLLTIDFLLKIAKKVNFGYFALFFGLLIIVSAFI